MKEKPEQLISPERFRIRTASLEELNFAVRKITTQTQDEYFAHLRAKHGSSYHDFFSTSDFYVMLSNRLPRRIPERLNREALEKFKDKDKRYENLFIILNIRTIASAAKKYFKKDSAYNDELMQDLIEKLYNLKLNPSSTLPLSQFIHTYTRSYAEDMTKKNIAEYKEKQQIINDSSVIPVVEDLESQRRNEEKLYAQLENAVSRLPDRTKNIIHSKFYEGKTLKQIAIEQRISRERVRIILSRAVIGLRYKNILDRYPLIQEYQKNLKR